MKFSNKLLTLGSLALMLACQPSGKNLQLGKVPNKKIIEALTLEEKALLLVGDDPGFPRGYPGGFGGEDSLFSSQPPAVGHTEREVPGAAGTTYPIPRLGIPAIVLADGPAGVRIDPTRPDTSKTFYATAFPIESLLACTWNTDLVHTVGKTMGTEALEYGVDILLAPALNIQRNPLGGRNFEYYSEDPVLSGEMAAAMVNGVQSVGVGTSIKHFAVNNNETNRMHINAVIDDVTLHEIYLKGFEIAVKKSQPWTVMSAYNKINGVYCAENPVLLDSVLRGAWGFQGLVMTDWFAGRDRTAQVQAGNDLLMPGSKYIAEKLVEAVENGSLSEADIDRNVNRILEVIQKTPKFKKYPYSNTPNLLLDAQVAKEAATEGMVLLKNDKESLPLKGQLTIAGFGLGTYKTIAVGTGSGNVNMAYSTSLKKGLETLGHTLLHEMELAYNQHELAEKKRVGEKASYFDPDIMLEEKAWSTTELQKIAQKTDVAIYTISRTSGEFADRKIENDFELTHVEKETLQKVATVFHAQNKKVIVVLNVGGVIETASWKANADAILLAWQAGQEGGNAMAEILSGKASPSGKLAMTFPVRFSDLPSSAYFPDAAIDPDEVHYTEQDQVGYRAYTQEATEASFPFGFGLSYSNFKYQNLQLQKKDKEILVSCEISNSGSYPAKEIVQLYLTDTQSSSSKVLKAFSKTKVLAPGETTEVTLLLTEDSFTQYLPEKATWKVKKGNYQLSLAASSTDIRLHKEFTY